MTHGTQSWYIEVQKQLKNKIRFRKTKTKKEKLFKLYTAVFSVWGQTELLLYFRISK